MNQADAARQARNAAREARGRAAALAVATYDPSAAGGRAPDVAAMIDHTLLKPDSTAAQIRAVCSEAREYGFATVCVNAMWVGLCHTALAGSDVGITAVVGFPLGATTTDSKVFEARQAIDAGADEIDMVIAVGAFKGGDEETVRRDIEAVAGACHARGALLKVILETVFLSDEEKGRASRLAVAAGADYVKTSTGFSGGGATPSDVALMRQAVGPAPGVKAAGGVKTFADAQAMAHAGATRIGASAGAKLVRELQGEQSAGPGAGY